MITWKKLNKCHSCFVILTKFLIDQFLRDYPKQSRIILTKLNFFSVISPENLHKILDQPDAKLQTITSWSIAFSCVSSSLSSHRPWPYKLWLWVVVGNAKWLWFFNALLKTAVSHAFNPLTPMGDQNIISPYNINTISTR